MSFQDSTNELEEFRDLWFFSYLCNGINFMDLLFLQYSNIVDGEICFIRSKTSRTTKHSKEIRATITPEMWDIIHKWGNPNISPQTYIFKYAKGNEDAFEKIKLVRRIVTKCNRKLKKNSPRYRYCSTDYLHGKTFICDSTKTWWSQNVLYFRKSWSL